MMAKAIAPKGGARQPHARRAGRRKAGHERAGHRTAGHRAAGDKGGRQVKRSRAGLASTAGTDAALPGLSRPMAAGTTGGEAPTGGVRVPRMALGLARVPAVTAAALDPRLDIGPDGRSGTSARAMTTACIRPAGR